MRKSPTYTLLIASCLLSLSGCGQKDALYLPEDPDAQAADSAPSVDSPTTDGAPAETNEDETKKKDPPVE